MLGDLTVNLEDQLLNHIENNTLVQFLPNKITKLDGLISFLTK
jgi:hypothetical protein